MANSSKKEIIQEELGGWSVTALAINADATNRIGELQKDLVGGLQKLIESTQAETKHKLSIVTVSELNSTKNGEELANNLGWSCATEFIGKNDALFTAYDPAVWELCPETNKSSERSEGADYSKVGRYLAMKLQMKTKGHKLLYISVHLPHKSNKKEAYDALNRMIKDRGSDVDGIMIGGDWNMKPDDIKSEFPVEQLAFESGGTSESGRTIDNFALMKLPKKNRKASFGSRRIMTEKQKVYTTHAPIVAEAKFTAAPLEPAAESSVKSEKEKVLVQASSGAKQGLSLAKLTANASQEQEDKSGAGKRTSKKRGEANDARES